MSRRVVVLQHVAVETLGTIEAALAAAMIGFDYVPVDRYPHLTDEIRLIEHALANAKPILGICLGSQLLAHALGARVYQGPQKEIGWHRVTLTAEAAADRLWSGAPSTFAACHWHGDVFDLPAGATLLARSELTAHQAFRYGASAYGTLFHVETTETVLRNMIATFADELQGAGLSGERIAAAGTDYLPPLAAIGRGVFDRWAALV